MYRGDRRERRSKSVLSHGRRPKALDPNCRGQGLYGASYGLPTHVWHDFIKDDPPLLHGIVHTPRLVVFGGGYPIKEGGELIGAIGLSGGHYKQDMECAQAALTAISAEVP